MLSPMEARVSEVCRYSRLDTIRKIANTVISHEGTLQVAHVEMQLRFHGRKTSFGYELPLSSFIYVPWFPRGPLGYKVISE